MACGGKWELQSTTWNHLEWRACWGQGFWDWNSTALQEHVRNEEIDCGNALLAQTDEETEDSVLNSWLQSQIKTRGLVCWRYLISCSRKAETAKNETESEPAAWQVISLADVMAFISSAPWTSDLWETVSSAFVWSHVGGYGVMLNPSLIPHTHWTPLRAEATSHCLMMLALSRAHLTSPLCPPIPQGLQITKPSPDGQWDGAALNVNPKSNFGHNCPDVISYHQKSGDSLWMDWPRQI